MAQQGYGQIGQQSQPQQQGQFEQQGRGGTQTQQFRPSFGPEQILGNQFSQMAPPQISEAVIALDRLETVAEYCHSQAMQQGNHQVALIADGIEEIARLQKELVVTESPLAQEMSRCCQQVLQQGVQQLQGYSQQPEVQELVSETQQLMTQVPQSLQQTMGGGMSTGQGF